jgi:hypothetical protein
LEEEAKDGPAKGRKAEQTIQVKRHQAEDGEADCELVSAVADQIVASQNHNPNL